MQSHLTEAGAFGGGESHLKQASPPFFDFHIFILTASNGCFLNF